MIQTPSGGYTKQVHSQTRVIKHEYSAPSLYQMLRGRRIVNLTVSLTHRMVKSLWRRSDSRLRVNTNISLRAWRVLIADVADRESPRASSLSVLRYSPAASSRDYHSRTRSLRP